MKSRTALLASIPFLGLTSSVRSNLSVTATTTVAVTGAVNEQAIWVGLVIINGRAA